MDSFRERAANQRERPALRNRIGGTIEKYYLTADERGRERKSGVIYLFSAPPDVNSFSSRDSTLFPLFLQRRAAKSLNPASDNSALSRFALSKNATLP